KAACDLEPIVSPYLLRGSRPKQVDVTRQRSLENFSNTCRWLFLTRNSPASGVIRPGPFASCSTKTYRSTWSAGGSRLARYGQVRYFENGFKPTNQCFGAML